MSPSHLGVRTRGWASLLHLGGYSLGLSFLFPFPPAFWFLCILLTCGKKRRRSQTRCRTAAVKPGKTFHQRNPAQKKRRAQGRRGITRKESCGLLHSLLDFCCILGSFSSSLFFARFVRSGGLRMFEENWLCFITFSHIFLPPLFFS